MPYEIPCSSVNWNARNHEISPEQRRRGAAGIRRDLAWAHDAPDSRAASIVGDFNFGDCDEVDPFVLDQQTPTQQ
eukprot:5060806-Pyramimonas_sp.AAC.1